MKPESNKARSKQDAYVVGNICPLLVVLFLTDCQNEYCEPAHQTFDLPGDLQDLPRERGKLRRYQHPCPRITRFR